MSLSTIEAAINSAATNVITLAAGVNKAVSALEASDPLVATGISLVENEFPAVKAAAGVEAAVLTLAQAIVSQTQAKAAMVTLIAPPATAPASTSVAAA